MNKAILMGRLVRDPEIRYSQSATPICVAKYTLAVPRKFKKDGEPDCDFINCVAFGKNGEFAEKYLSKGQQIMVVGSIKTGSYENKEGVKVYTTDIVVEEHYFTGKKDDSIKPTQHPQNFLSEEEIDPESDLPF